VKQEIASFVTARRKTRKDMFFEFC